MFLLLMQINSDILAGVGYHTVRAEPFFYTTSYTHTRQLGAVYQ